MKYEKVIGTGEENEVHWPFFKIKIIERNEGVMEIYIRRMKNRTAVRN